MGKKDPRVDAYIAKSAEFARPILTHIRELVHEGCPEVEETLKWQMPSFVCKGILCGMAAFKQHATFGFWKRELVLGKEGKAGGMGQVWGIISRKDWPADKVLLEYIRKAVEVNEAGIKSPTRARPKPSQQRK